MAGNESNDRGAPGRSDKQGDGRHQPNRSVEQQGHPASESNRAERDRSAPTDRRNQGSGQIGSRSSSEARR